MPAAARPEEDEALCGWGAGDDGSMSWLDASQFEDNERFAAVELFTDAAEVARRIENCVASFVEEGGRTGAGNACGFEVASRAASNAGVGSTGHVRLGRASATIGSRSPAKLAKFVRLLAFIHRLLVEGKHATQRDIYYCLVDSFASQRELNTMLQDCVCLLGCSRIAMGISTSSRGFLAGNAVWRGGAPLDCRRAGPQGLAIPGCLPPGLRIDSTAPYVLVVEKDCVFQQLCEARVWEHIDCVLVTGCGFPDLNTRVAVWLLLQRPSPPTVLGLVDYNPSGVAILMTYMHGSRGMGLETHRYTVPVRWLGLHAADVAAKGGVSLPLTRRDRSVLAKLQAASVPAAWRGELDGMSCKVELQAAYNAFRAPENVSLLHDKIVQGRYL